MLLGREQLAALRNALEHQPVLSVYLAHAADNPADRMMRQSALVNAITAVRNAIGLGDKAEREAFERSVGHLGATIDAVLSGAQGLGWIGFITSAGVQFAGTVPAPLPTLARWQRGIWATPAVRALTGERPIIVAVVDGVSSRLYRYAGGVLVKVDDLDVYVHGGHAGHLGALPRSGFHTGTRGTPGADLAARSRVNARDRVIAATAARLAELDGELAYVVIGGNAAAAHALQRALPHPVAARALLLPELKAKANDATIRDLAVAGASRLRDAGNLALVARLLEDVGAHGLAVAGPQATLAALADGRVHAVLLTERFIGEHDVDAERAVSLALGHAATVEVVAGAGAAELDRSAGGIGAQLRFVPAPAAPLVGT